jgi:hypothetical protein
MKFNLMYEQLLAELFNTKQEAEWFYNEGEFQTILRGPNDITYMLNLTPYWNIELPAEAFNVKQMTPEQWKILEHGTWHVEFADDEASDQIGVTGDQGMNSSKVFSLIGNALLDKVKKEPKIFKSLVFSGEGQSRRSLYNKIAPVLARKLGKDLVVSDNGEWYFLINHV